MGTTTTLFRRGMLTYDQMTAARALKLKCQELADMLGCTRQAVRAAEERHGIWLEPMQRRSRDGSLAVPRGRSVVCGGCGARFIPAPFDKLNRCAQCRAARVEAVLDERRNAA